MITPDTKDWTWVLERPCAECGLDTSAIPFEAVPGLIRGNGRFWAELLAEGEADGEGGDGRGLRERPAPEVWSPLEYACHVRDVFRTIEGRLRLMLAEDDPVFPDWDQDATAVEDRYREQDPAAVAAEVGAAAERLARAYEGVPDAGRERTGERSDGARFTVASLGRYVFHDVDHHRYDVTRGQQKD
ncbi:DinB family protein [Kitasatospora sp. NPDC088783]|uniref:DinB family protein n=1 Tax=Kitasatospora sp. NPDC088783 TaxID=3364077 RepID=UPI00382B7105